MSHSVDLSVDRAIRRFKNELRDIAYREAMELDDVITVAEGMGWPKAVEQVERLSFILGQIEFVCQAWSDESLYGETVKDCSEHILRLIEKVKHD